MFGFGAAGRGPKGFPAAAPAALQAELARRLGGVQRHRLLAGFPMTPVMGAAKHGGVWPQKTVGSRPLILGVLPHTFCAPAVKGCGFCTFPHEAPDKALMMPLAAGIAAEVASRQPLWRFRRVRALYIGGGTANLASLPALAMILGALAGCTFDEAELTLEGAPRFFKAEQLELLQSLPGTRARVSMGVQTFDEAQLLRMGRAQIGGPAQVEAALALAQAAGATTSIDLLINLPGQPVAAMLADVARAVAMGVDQICVYHLVLRAGLGVPWAEQPETLAALPDNAAAFEHWRAVRGALLAAGYAQTTLTNFERPGAAPFLYERLSFAPHTSDALGFGPGALSGLNFGGAEPALKWLNEPRSADYAARRGGRVARLFLYEPHEEALMQLTRGLALLDQPTDAGPLAKHLSMFEPELSILEEAGLIERPSARLALTERGMFFADSVAGLLAARSTAHRRAVGLNEPAELHMG
jgi:coproporphyrinogen III oxidase-like Fe-S oxidoreductase